MTAKAHYALGFMNYCSHDPAASLARLGADGVVDYIHFEEGMLSRKKKSYQFPLRAIQACLDHYKIKIGDVDIVSVDFMNAKAAFNTASYYRKLVGDYIRAHLAIRQDKLHFADSHHLAHAYTAFYPSGFENAAVLAIDGLGSEQETHSIYVGDAKSGLKKVYSQSGTGIGHLYTYITTCLGFDHGEEGKTMGLAPYGAEHSALDAELPSFEGNYQGYCVDYSHLMHRSPSARLTMNLRTCQSREEVFSPYFTRMAYNVQKELERALLHLCTEIRSRTGCARLCIAGGIGLNCVANEIIRRSGIFEEVYVQPASGDSGIALGLAMIGLEKAVQKAPQGNGECRIEWWKNVSSFWTYAPVEFDNRELISLLELRSVPYHAVNIESIVDELARGKVIAHFEGGWEFGPRALGHRSFLADPRTAEMKAVLNRKIKHREGYRPFAPIVLEHRFADLFDSPVTSHPHMLFAVNCKERAKEACPTIVHVDGTARVQTCSQSAGRIYSLLEAFEKKTGVPVLVNTSLNDNDEPIVMTPLDALSCFLRTNADALVVNDIVVWRSEVRDVKGLTEASEALQLSQLRDKTDYAFRNLVGADPRFESVSDFLVRNLVSSLYASHNASTDRLANELFANNWTDRGEVLVTDDYHLAVLRQLETYYKKSIPFKSILLIEDHWGSLKEIPERAWLLLYNISALTGDAEVSKAYPAIATCRSFYRKADRRIKLPSPSATLENVLEEIQNSYEVNPSLTIDDYFDSAVSARFADQFL